MCARFSQVVPPEQMERLLDVPIPVGLTTRFNVAPTQEVLVVTQPTDRREAGFMSWGLILPRGSESQRYVNARAEGLLDGSTFRGAYQRRRCLVPASSFFEWKAVSLQPTFDLFDAPETGKGVKKYPYAIGVEGEELFGLAGIWETWRTPAGELQNTFAILTTEANELVRPLHERMPVIIPTSEAALWFGNDEEARRALMLPYPADRMWMHRVSTDMNNPRNEFRELLRAIPEA